MTTDLGALLNGYQVFPPLTPDEAGALREDIRLRGVLVPVELDENGAILDGHHRVTIAQELGIEWPTIVRSGLSEADKLEHVFALNFARRQLNGITRTNVITECRRRGMSLRAIAKLTGVSHETVRRLGDEPVTDVTPLPSTPEPIPEPLTAPVTRGERAREMAAEGAPQSLIAAELGISQQTVSNLLKPNGSPGQTNPDSPVEWSATQVLLRTVRELPSKSPEPRLIARSVPDRNRASVARDLRRVGTFLGSIALELERKDR